MKKMHPALLIILAVVGAIVPAWFGPWWAPAAFLVAWFMLTRQPRRTALVNGSLILAFVYGVTAGWMMTLDTSNLLGKTGVLLGGLPTVALLVITIMIGWITGLLSGWLGSVLGDVVFEKKAT